MIGPYSRFSGTKKISSTNSASGSIYLKDSVTTMKLCKLDLTEYNMVDQP